MYIFIGIFFCANVDNNEAASGEPSEDRRLDMIAPLGKVGFILANPMEVKSACMLTVHNESMLPGKILKGGQIMVVDNKDLSKLQATEVSMLLVAKRNDQEKLALLRGANHRACQW